MARRLAPGAGPRTGSKEGGVDPGDVARRQATRWTAGCSVGRARGGAHRRRRSVGFRCFGRRVRRDGPLPEAAVTATRALTAANAQGNRQVAEAIEARIALYEKRARFREVNHQE